ncbi:hypothetical protein [Nonomuraea sp. NPDC049695]|uniref:hypothetical protein n=1 Tax=Nonomuraea sp. NPDC049695 TaxID=3154734 RepID=UPI003424C75E
MSARVIAARTMMIAGPVAAGGSGWGDVSGRGQDEIEGIGKVDEVRIADGGGRETATKGNLPTGRHSWSARVRVSR